MPETIIKQTAENQVTPKETTNSVKRRLEATLQANRDIARRMLGDKVRKGLTISDQLLKMAELATSNEATRDETVVLNIPKSGVRSTEEALEMLINTNMESGRPAPDYVQNTAQLLNKEPIIDTKPISKSIYSGASIDTKMKLLLGDPAMPAAGIERLVFDSANKEYVKLLKIKKIDEKMTFLRKEMNKFQSETFEKQRFALQKEYGMLVALKGTLKSGKPIAKSNNLN